MPSKISTTFKPLREIKTGYVYPLSKLLIKTYIREPLHSFLLNYIQKLQEDVQTFKEEKLRPYQLEDAIKMLNRKRMALFNEQRLGKTPTVLTVVKHLPIELKVLIIAPKSTHYQWEQECIKWCSDKVYRLRGTKTQRNRAYNNNYKIYITTYETCHIDFEKLQQLNFDIMIIDEAHRLHNYRGDRSNSSPAFTKSVINLAKAATYLYPLTGTPAPNYSWQVYPILHMLYPNTFSSFWGFVEYFYSIETVYTKNDSINKPGDFINMFKQKELQDFLNLNTIQRKRKDYMKWLPKIDAKIVHLELDKHERKWYNELTDNWECEELGYDCPNKLVLMTRLRQVTSTLSTKLNYILDYIKDYPDEQIIITSTFSNYLLFLQTMIPDSQIIIGETSSKKRGELEQKFNNKEFKILLGNVEVLKEGMKLEQGNTIIEVDPSLVSSDNQQLYDRIIPTTEQVAEQKGKQQIIKLICKDTIDEYINEQLSLKKSSADIVNNFMKGVTKPNE